MMVTLKPFDTIFFRDGKPFTSGEDVWANPVFPPNPSVLYGALRSAYIAHNGGLTAFVNGLMKDSIGYIERRGDENVIHNGAFTLRGIFLNWSDMLYLPAPLDLVFDKNADKSNKYKAHLMKMVSPTTSFFGNHVTQSMLFPQAIEEAESADECFISLDDLNKYLNSSGNFACTLKPRFDFILNEPKTGIKISDSKSAEEGYLYRAEMLRLASKNPSGYRCDVGISVLLEGLKLVNFNGMIKIGGEGKGAFALETSEYHLPEIAKESLKQINNTKRFKLYIATPCIFHNGWKPNIEQNNITIHLLSACVGKFILCGGWDIYNNRPKTMYRAVPAGSVYYYEIKKGDAEDILNAFHGKSISEYNSQQGFGISYVGIG